MDKTLDDAVVGVARGLGVPFLGLRFTHVRNTGVETDVWDGESFSPDTNMALIPDFDFGAIRDRAIAQGSHTEVIRVYSGALGRTPAGSRANSFSPASAFQTHGHDPNGRREAPAFSFGSGSIPPSNAPTPRSALRSPASNGSPRSQKRVVLALPSDTPPSTPSPTPDAGSTKKKRKQRKQSIDAVASASNQPFPATSAAGGAVGTSPSGNAQQHRIETLAAKYKPARPSPLSQASPSKEQGKGKGKAPAVEQEEPASKRSKSNPPLTGIVPPVVGTLPPPVGTIEETSAAPTPSTSSLPVEQTTSNATGSNKTRQRRARKSLGLAANAPPSADAPPEEEVGSSTEASSSTAAAVVNGTRPDPAPIVNDTAVEKTAATSADSASGPVAKSAKKSKKDMARKKSSESVAPWMTILAQVRAENEKARTATSSEATAAASSPEESAAPAATSSAPAEPEAAASAPAAAPVPKTSSPAEEPAPGETPVTVPANRGPKLKTAVSTSEPAVEEASEEPAKKLPAKRGPRLKNNAPPVDEPATDEEEQVEESPKKVPAKRGRPKKAAPPVDEPVIEEPEPAKKLPAKRGPKPNTTTPATDESAWLELTPQSPVKRGPGRPKKVPAAAAAATPATTTAVTAPAPVRPAEERATEEPAPKVPAKRGRKPKDSEPTPEETVAEAPAAEDAADVPVKRGPGRPRKDGTAPKSAPKRGPGRPRKVITPVEAALEDAPAEGASGDLEIEEMPAAEAVPAIEPTSVEEEGATSADKAMDVDETPSDPPAPVENDESGADVEMEAVVEGNSSKELVMPSSDEGRSNDSDAASHASAERGTTEALEEEACLLCAQAADHAPKECPVVLGGVPRLRERLAERRAELPPGDGRTRAIRNDAVIEACQQWITRLTKVASKVVNGTPQQSESASRSSLIKAAINGTPTPKGEAVAKATPKAPPTPTPVTAAARFAAANGAKSPVARDSETDELDTSDDDESTPLAPAPGAIAPATPGTPDTPFYPQSLHRMAAARAARRPGSSRLSVSDAVIETGDSSDSDSESGSGSDSDSGSESESDSDNDASVDSGSGSGSTSGSDSDSDGDSSSADDIDPADLLRQVMTRPLSQRERAEAARSAASMHAVTQEDIAEVSDASGSDADEIALSRMTQRRGSDSSIGDFVDGGEDVNAHMDDEDSEAEDKNRLLSHVVAASQGAVKPSVAMDVDEEEGQTRVSNVNKHSNGANANKIPSPASLKTIATPLRPASSHSFGSNRSFTRLAMSSPVLDDLPGDIALREAINEDAAPLLDDHVSSDLAATQIDVRAPPSPPLSDRAQPTASSPPLKLYPMGSQEIREPSPSPSPENESSPTPPPPPKRRGRPPKNSLPPASQPVRRSARVVSPDRDLPASQPTGRVTRMTRSISNSGGNSSASASGSALSPRVTRSASARGSTSPQAKFARIPIREEESDGDEYVDATPRATQSQVRRPLATSTDAQRRGFPSSLASQPRPSQARPVSPSSSIDASQSIPVPATQSSPLRRRGVQDETPLFMTQPSQMPATQGYHCIPPALVPETQENGHDSGSDAHSDVHSEHSEHSEHSFSDHSAHSDVSAETGTTSLYPALPTLRSSQPAPITSSFPTLSSLPKDLLRHGGEAVQSVWNRVTGAKDEREESDDDSSDDDSSDEDEVPERLRGRIAGGARSAKKPQTRGMMRGW